MATLALIISALALLVSLYTLVGVLSSRRKIKDMKSVTDWHRPLG